MLAYCVDERPDGVITTSKSNRKSCPLARRASMWPLIPHLRVNAIHYWCVSPSRKIFSLLGPPCWRLRACISEESPSSPANADCTTLDP
mmetsp:Transcript_104574/g.165058  ORF Transcript_104574/g.165058 Transcript_104574/m.165058 type:complete len:89 (-) Transcript_104574:968-1234(-)